MNIISFVMIRINFLQTFLSNYNVDTPVSLGLIKLCFSILLARCWLNRLIKYKFCEIAKLIIWKKKLNKIEKTARKMQLFP